MRKTVMGGAGTALAAALLLGALGARERAQAALETPGFRAVGVARSAEPISAVAVAPDGRLFATVQYLDQSTDPDPTSAEIRVYQGYAMADGSVLDQGAVWATIDDVRATTPEEGVLGLALAPDFATSKLVFVYLTTTDDDADQQVRVFRENASGTGDFVGTVRGALEPPQESSNRNGGPLTFGADGCLYLGVGDNGNGGRWNAQVLVGTDPFGGTETADLCTDVCLGTASFPDRSIDHDGEPNSAGKVLRMAVEGASPAQAGPGSPLAAQPFAFTGGMRNPVGLATHPLTGQLYVAERGDTLQSEIGVADAGSNHGWPCLEGTVVGGAGSVPCLAGVLPEAVLGNHGDWKRPLAVHLGTPAPLVTGLSAYTGLGYPEEFYGDVFYLLRDSARIYRINLTPPCFLPHPSFVVPVEFHDTTQDGDFVVLYDVDDDGDFENVALQNLVAIVQAPNPQGQLVLYVVGRQGNGFTDDSVIFRIEYATLFTPYAGPTGRVPDSCFSDGIYSGGGTGTPPYAFENPFKRQTCLPPGGPCPGQPDGTPCDDGDTCNGAEACEDGICRHGPGAADGTACGSGNPCRPTGVCQALDCVEGTPAPDGTPCPDTDPCNGFETCGGGTCQPGAGPSPLGVQSLKMKRELKGPGTGTLSLKGSFRALAPIAPHQTDTLTLELSDPAGVLFSALLDHPASDPFWRGKRSRFRYVDKGGSVGGLTSVDFRAQPGGNVQVSIKGRHMTWNGLDDAALTPRLLIGGQCYAATLPGCDLDDKRLRCK